MLLLKKKQILKGQSKEMLIQKLQESNQQK